jgi:large subunit ribosomal protein L17
MRHRVVGRTLGRRAEPRLAMVHNLVRELLRHERITTTEAKAREAQRVAERIITKGKGGSVHDRRQVLAVVPDERVVRKLFDELAPRYEGRSGGYTRMRRLVPRQGDAAPMAILELV